MAVSTRIIRRRIKSTKSIGKIVKAMELVAASKMRRATQLALGTRPYANLIQEMTAELRTRIDPKQYAYLVGPGIPRGSSIRTLVVLLASDRGLCGGFNSQIVKKTLEFIRSRDSQIIRVMTVGRRAEQAVRRANLELIASFGSISNAPSFERVKPAAEYISKEFLEQKVDRVFVAFTDFKSALSQVPTVVQLLPIMPEAELPKESTMIEEKGEEGETEHSDERVESEDEEEGTIFEPGSDAVMQKLLPSMVEMKLYQAFLESAASEQSARMVAMKSAGDAATEMLSDLTFTLNQARQASITREISEISAGTAALK
ncbi:MAG TPA: ATP synthase F1 subunit gamma [Patescibacteria group bacterium]|nr:ATP synthase F1 subunit gamma [Patescibacteria group bacterium]